VLYLVYEYGRPAYPMNIPMGISTLLAIGWLGLSDKKWSPQVACFFALIGLMLLDVPVAVNTYAAFWTTYGMATVLLCTCVPMTSFVSSVRQIRVWIYSFIGVAAYVGIYAILHGGFGPSGAGGAQDENYVAAMMGMAISCAYFALLAETRRLGRVLLTLSIPVFAAAIVVGFSRGGFIGLCAVVAYCLARSSKKLTGLAVVAAIGLTVMTVAHFYVNTTHTHTTDQSSGSTFWDEMGTIGDVDEGTADLRIEVWKIGLRMFAAHPILGVGPGSFRWTVGDYQSEEQLARYGRSLGGSIFAHSLFVECLAELGAVGAGLFLMLLGYTWRDLREIRRRARTGISARHGQEGREPEAGTGAALRYYADAAAGSILACLVNGLFLSLFYFSYVWLFIALVVAIKQVAAAPPASMPEALDAPPA